MKPLNFIQPYSDEVLEWNSKTKRYELTKEFVKQEFEINFRDDGILEKRLKLNSRKIYNYIKYFSYTGNSQIIDTLLSKTKEGREFLKDVLLEQFAADNDTGYNDLSKQPAVNLATGQVLDRNELIRNQICVDAQQIIERNADYFGFNICVMSRYSPDVYLYLTRI